MAVGDWTLHVSDQSREGHNGTFLGWGMTLWGSAIDAAKANKFELPNKTDDEEHALPPHPSATQDGDNTKQHPKPTEHLPTDHVTASGETTKPAFESTGTTSASTTGVPIPSSIAGIKNPVFDFIMTQVWLLGIGGIVLLVGGGGGYIIWRRLQKKPKRRG